MDSPSPRLPRFAPRQAYYDYVARGYDLIAPTYDEVEGANLVGRRLRAALRAALFRTFSPGEFVLEIGCGTGLDALAIAERGVRVLATDISQAMVDAVRAKAAERGLANLEARRLAASEVGQLLDELGPAALDGAYSHAGALNMDPDLPAVGEGLRRLVRPGGRVVCSVVNQASLFEVLFYPLVLRPRKAFRRLGNVIPIPITRLEAYRRYVVPTRFYSPKAFVSVLGDGFVLTRLEGLQILLPPWNLADLAARLSPLYRAVEAIERRLADRPPFNAWGSLYLLEMERTPT